MSPRNATAVIHFPHQFYKEETIKLHLLNEISSSKTRHSAKINLARASARLASKGRRASAFVFLLMITSELSFVCTIRGRVYELFISHLSHVHPWDGVKIFPESIQNDSGENDSIMAAGVHRPCVVTSQIASRQQKQKSNMNNVKSKIQSRLFTLRL